MEKFNPFEIKNKDESTGGKFEGILRRFGIKCSEIVLFDQNRNDLKSEFSLAALIHFDNLGDAEAALQTLKNSCNDGMATFRLINSMPDYAKSSNAVCSIRCDINPSSFFEIEGYEKIEFISEVVARDVLKVQLDGIGIEFNSLSSLFAALREQLDNEEYADFLRRIDVHPETAISIMFATDQSIAVKFLESKSIAHIMDIFNIKMSKMNPLIILEPDVTPAIALPYDPHSEFEGDPNLGYGIASPKGCVDMGGEEHDFPFITSVDYSEDRLLAFAVNNILKGTRPDLCDME